MCKQCRVDGEGGGNLFYLPIVFGNLNLSSLFIVFIINLMFQLLKNQLHISRDTPFTKVKEFNKQICFGRTFNERYLGGKYVHKCCGEFFLWEKVLSAVSKVFESRIFCPRVTLF